MSRICVKNLPKYVKEDRLQEFFSKNGGEITDVKVMRTKEGKSRQFAFIGFHTEQQAEAAILYFNKSYLDTCRITCEIAHKVGDPNIPRPWSQYSSKKENETAEDGGKVAGNKNLSVLGSERERETHNNEAKNDDPQLQEFLEVMQPRVKSKLWANDTSIALVANKTGKTIEKQTLTNKGSTDESFPLFVESDKKMENVLPKELEINESENLVRSDVMSDMDYFKSRVKKDWSDSDSDDRDDEKSLNESLNGQGIQDTVSDRQPIAHAKAIFENKFHEEDPEKPSSDMLDQGNPLSSLKEENDDVRETGRLFVRNLPYTTTEEELETLFRKFGEVSQVHIVLDRDTKRSKGIAYILYTIPECAARALEEVDNSIFQGRLLHVMPAKQKNPSEKQGTEISVDQGSKTFKQRREEERKAAEANGDTRAWNTFFMRSDTVVENIARKYGVNKSDLLDPEADDLAVRVALGEAQVIAETKKALTNAGVDVEYLESFAAGKTDGIKRSNHVLLVKNLPYATSDGELAKMFGKFGSLDKVILPPTKSMALVVFLEPAAARAAFKGLAYKRYKDGPLYLEWAPANVICQSSTSGLVEKKNAIIGENEVKRAISEQHVEGISDEDIDPDRVESRSLFVKNLNFRTSDDSLKKHFSDQMKQGKILSTKIKKHLKNGKLVSMGYGFIEFDSLETATSTCTDSQGSVLDGHALILQLCHAKKDEQVRKKVEKDKSSTKLLVKNVAFEATKKDLRQLFSPFGQVKSLRIPKKFGNHRGFAFVEFVTKQEAENALKALSSTHLYGRHLVIERAKEGETLEELRKRTAAQFTDEQNGFQDPTKLSKKRKHMAVLDEGRMKFERIADY